MTTNHPIVNAEFANTLETYLRMKYEASCFLHQHPELKAFLGAVQHMDWLGAACSALSLEKGTESVITDDDLNVGRFREYP